MKPSFCGPTGTAPATSSAAAERQRQPSLRAGVVARRGRAGAQRSPAHRRRDPAPCHRIRPQQARGRRGCPSQRPAAGRSSGRPSSTVPATGRSSRSSGWHGSGWRRCSGTDAQELSAVHAADLAEALVSRRGEPPRRLGGTYAACHPEVFTSAELGHAVARAMGRSVSHHPDSQARSDGPLLSLDRSRRPTQPDRPPSSPPTRRTSSSSRPGPAILVR